MLDKDGYPTEAILKTIETWSFTEKSIEDFLNLIKCLWSYPDRYVLSGKRILRLYLSTGGWSGNENVIEAMQRNAIFWMMCWQKSVRGGHFWFRIDKKQWARVEGR